MATLHQHQVLGYSSGEKRVREWSEFLVEHWQLHWLGNSTRVRLQTFWKGSWCGIKTWGCRFMLPGKQLMYALPNHHFRRESGLTTANELYAMVQALEQAWEYWEKFQFDIIAAKVCSLRLFHSSYPPKMHAELRGLLKTTRWARRYMG